MASMLMHYRWRKTWRETSNLTYPSDSHRARTLFRTILFHYCHGYLVDDGPAKPAQERAQEWAQELPILHHKRTSLIWLLKFHAAPVKQYTHVHWSPLSSRWTWCFAPSPPAPHPQSARKHTGGHRMEGEVQWLREILSPAPLYGNAHQGKPIRLDH